LAGAVFEKMRKHWLIASAVAAPAAAHAAGFNWQYLATIAGTIWMARPSGSTASPGLFPAYAYTLGPSTKPKGSGCV